MFQQILIGARSSPLSRTQVFEVVEAIKRNYPDLEMDFQPVWIDTMGDLDKKSSLRDREKTDFFTRQIDEALLAGSCRIAVHAAKDLPEPLPAGVALVALTAGIDPADALVLPVGMSFAELPKFPLIATSSSRREEAVRSILPAARFCDIRGTIAERLDFLDSGACDGLVVAEAALIRLQMRRERVILEGATAPMQGRLAVVALDTDEQMRQLFSCLTKL